MFRSTLEFWIQMLENSEGSTIKCSPVTWKESSDLGNVLWLCGGASTSLLSGPFREARHAEICLDMSSLSASQCSSSSFFSTSSFEIWVLFMWHQTMGEMEGPLLTSVQEKTALETAASFRWSQHTQLYSSKYIPKFLINRIMKMNQCGSSKTQMSKKHDHSCCVTQSTFHRNTQSGAVHGVLIGPRQR